MNGYTIEVLSRNTGLGISKLRMIVSRNPELQSMPYSVKNGKARVFFDSFVDYLKKYEGIEESQKSQPVTNVTRSKLPSGAQMAAMLKVYGQAETVKRLDFVIGYHPTPSAPIVRQIEEPRASSEQIEADLRSLMPVKVSIAGSKIEAAAEGARSRASLREVSKLTQDRMNYHLPLGAS